MYLRFVCWMQSPIANGVHGSQGAEVNGCQWLSMAVNLSRWSSGHFVAGVKLMYAGDHSLRFPLLSLLF